MKTNSVLITLIVIVAAICIYSIWKFDNSKVIIISAVVMSASVSLAIVLKKKANK
jgi:hypothetical protein